jgi:hypothetical protein
MLLIVLFVLNYKKNIALCVFFYEDGWKLVRFVTLYMYVQRKFLSEEYPFKCWHFGNDPLTLM